MMLASLLPTACAVSPGGSAVYAPAEPPVEGQPPPNVQLAGRLPLRQGTA
jgi:hypothetical protein